MHKAMQVTLALQQKWESARRILGDRYRETMAQFGEVITAVAKARDLDILPATLQMIGESPDLESMGILYLVADAVELIDPTPQGVTNG